MKLFTKTACILLMAITLALSGQAVAFELTKDNPETLIGSKSNNYSISGFRLGITHDQAWRILKENNSLIGVKDGANPSRIYVYTQNQDGSRGKAVLYLIWEPGMAKLGQITVFQDYRNILSKNFRRLLTFEAVDDTSAFKRNFIGYANRSKISLDVPEIDMKHKTYFYDEIGLEISHQHSSDEDKVVFAIVQTTP